ncbi:MAG: hypothetical protein UT82_C0027G0004 [Parcubacteria group bacterium GW2011_GWB1_40_14]|nr:MAG: hypothetical protein UT82_C0027G0004 [Parcubacteria group bacterium GW2011_GWB1_40_14]
MDQGATGIMNQESFWNRLYKKHLFLVKCIFASSLSGIAFYFLSETINSFELLLLSCFLLIVSAIAFALDVLAWQAYQDRKYEETKNIRLEALNTLRKTLRIK